MKTHICLWGRRVNLRADWGCPLGPAQSCAGKATRAQDAILPHERNLGSVFNRADVAPAGTLDQFIFPCRLTVRGDGTVLDGHHRASILAERGENIDRLPREIMEKQP